SILDVTPEDADAYDLPSVSGAVVQQVTQGSPADEAGIEPQDVIVAVEGESVGYANQLQQRVAEFHPGDEVTVTVYRDGRRRDFDVRLGEAPINEVPTEQPTRPAAVEERLGIQVEPLTESLAQELGYDEAGGVVITRVQRASPADLQRVASGERILAVNDREVSTPEEVRDALADVRGGQVVTLHLELPDGTPRYVNVRMPGR
ncbi:MAG TPA: PDZ domain-containing protein, partial [Longimicrobiales bacterium]|nr:PDZ domain-containing protein [Longimicrobiales bacterium]